MSKRDYVPVKGHSGLVRDVTSNALINLNSFEVEQARERKKNKNLKKQQDENLRKEVSDIQSELNEIKDLLKNLINKI